MIRRIIISLSLVSVLCSVTTAQQQQSTPLIEKWNKGYHQSVDAVKQAKLQRKWSQNGDALIFKRDLNHPPEILKCTLKTGKLEPASKADIQYLNTSDKKSKRSTKQQQAPKRADGTSPDGQWLAEVKNGKVFLKKSADDQATAVGTPQQKDHYYLGKAIWNASSTHFYVSYVEPGQRRHFTMVESSPKGQLQPKVHRVRYDKPGDHIDRSEPHLFGINRSQFKPDRKLTKDAFSISHVGWNQAGDELRYEYVERGYGKHYLIAMDARTGQERLIAKEESDTFIFVGGIRYRKDLPHTNEIIWGSDRDGWRHLYLLDASDGSIKHRITRGDWLVRSIEHVDVSKRQIIFSASGKNQGEDPYHLHWYRVNFDGSQLTTLTEGDGTHQLEFSPDRSYYIDTWSRVDHPPVYELRRSHDGTLVTELTRANADGLQKYGRRLPERFTCKDRHGRFDIWGIIHTPPNFDPKKKYPVIENIYAGPHGAFVPKSFSVWRRHISELVEEGFIVVNIDGLGTNYRHHDFWHYSYKNLVDSGFPDRIKWIKEAAKSRPYMDISRVGIFGGSAGGQSSTAALLHHGEFYKVAVSDCGCHDNRMDKIWWNEQWMDWPVGPHYKEQSNATHAGKLNGALMLTVGELDRNVDPASTTQLVDALIKAGKDFDYHILPGGGHGAGEHAYLRQKRAHFFHRHLGKARK